MIVKGIQAFIVCVNYGDLLSITLPKNKSHFDKVIVITSPADHLTISVCRKEDVRYIVTDSFYDDGALFNKWKGLSQALTLFVEDQWICLLDADILFPSSIDFTPIFGNLYVPKRRMVKDSKQWEVYNDSDFKTFPLSKINEEFAGYAQIFHSKDPRVGALPWHEQNWKHAGGADSFLWMKWPDALRIRPGFEVLHFGEDGLNWGGRVTPMMDGSILEGSKEREERLRNLLSLRRGRKRPERYKEEKL